MKKFFIIFLISGLSAGCQAASSANGRQQYLFRRAGIMTQKRSFIIGRPKNLLHNFYKNASLPTPVKSYRQQTNNRLPSTRSFSVNIDSWLETHYQRGINDPKEIRVYSGLRWWTPTPLSPLGEAVIAGNIEHVQKLLEHRDVNVNIKLGTEAWTPLHWAVCAHRIAYRMVGDPTEALQRREIFCQITKELLGHPLIDANARDIKAITPLHIALGAYHGQSISTDSALVTILLEARDKQGEKQVDIHLRDGMRGWTPLHWAASLRGSAIPLLIEAGADVNATSDDGFCDTPLLTAIRTAVRGGRTWKKVQALVQAGADPSTRDSTRWTALHLVATQFINHPELVRVLIKAGVDVNARTSWSQSTPLHLALEGGKGGVAHQLMAIKNVDIHAVDAAGNTPLHALMCAPHVKRTVKALMRAGAKVTSENNIGETPLDLARKHQDPKNIPKISWLLCA